MRDLTLNEIETVSGAGSEGLFLLAAIAAVTTAYFWSTSEPTISTVAIAPVVPACRSVWKEGYSEDVVVATTYDIYGRAIDTVNTYWHPGELVTVC